MVALGPGGVTGWTGQARDSRLFQSTECGLEWNYMRRPEEARMISGFTAARRLPTHISLLYAVGGGVEDRVLRVRPAAVDGVEELQEIAGPRRLIAVEARLNAAV